MSNSAATSKDLLSLFTKKLSCIYGERETSNIFFLLLNQAFGLSKIELRDHSFDKSQEDYIHQALDRLSKGEPIQHILGSVEFYGCEILVGPEVLVPRPETEELVDYVLKSLNGNEKNILDIGTGSGCIPIAFKKQLPDVNVFAIDVSEKAMDLAQKSADQNRVEVHFKTADILLADLTDLPKFDIIISNPPYIPEKEKKEMSKNVVEFELGKALFVPDDDPLLFYRRITLLAGEKLQSGGKLWFEIHESYGKEVADLLMKNGFDSVEIIQDLQGKDRFVFGMKV